MFLRMLVSCSVLTLGVAGVVTLAEDANPPLNIGERISNFTLSADGKKPWSLHDLKQPKAAVLVFLSFDCPMSNSYAQTLADLAKAYRERGVSFIGICTNDESLAWIAKQAEAFAIPFPVYADTEQRAMEALRATVTPEVFVLDSQFTLRYRGRIDDAYAARLKKNRQVTRHDLRAALDEVVAGKPVTMAVTQAIGCPITHAMASRPESGLVTYHRDVRPILQNHCQGCHRPGAVAPFALTSYKQAVSWADDIKEYTRARKMPPWKPSEGASLRDEMKLTDQEIATLAAWVDKGTPEGNPKDAPPPRKFPDGWHLGTPDLILSATEEFQVGPTGSDIFRCLVLPTNLPEDTYVTAVDVRPSNARVVHHAVLFYDTNDQARKLEKFERDRVKSATELDRGPGYSVAMGIGFLPNLREPPPVLGAWAPGQMPRYLPEGVGYLLPKGADLVVQMHYNRSGRVERDRTQIGLYFAKRPKVQRLQFIGVAAPFGRIPADDEKFKAVGRVWVNDDCTVHSIFPHMHLIGKQIKVSITPPDGSTQTLLAINDWDFNWQGDYFFKEPIRVKANTRFDIEGVFDNSAKNPANPHSPPRDVIFGMETTNEMCLAGIGAVSDKPGRIPFRFLK